MFRHRKKDAPNRASHAGRTLGRARPTCIPSHTEPAPRPGSAPRGRADARQALLRRTGRRRATRNEPTQRSHAPDSRNHSSHIVYSATLRGARIQMAKIFLPTPHSRSPAALSPGVPESRLPTPDSRAHSRSPAALTPGVPTPARTPGRTPGVPTPARTPGVPTPDSRADSRGPDSRLPRGLPGSRLPTPARAPDSRLPTLNPKPCPVVKVEMEALNPKP